jgi:hypothetical protein
MQLAFDDEQFGIVLDKIRLTKDSIAAAADTMNSLNQEIADAAFGDGKVFAAMDKMKDKFAESISITQQAVTSLEAGMKESQEGLSGLVNKWVNYWNND